MLSINAAEGDSIETGDTVACLKSHSLQVNKNGKTSYDLQQFTASGSLLGMTPGNFIMILASRSSFLYLAIGRGYEPLLLVPISFGMLLVNICPSIMEEGACIYFYLSDEWTILPSLIFLGVGAMTDFGPLIANPKSFLFGAAAQFGIYAAFIGALLLGFNEAAAAVPSSAVPMDQPSIYLAMMLKQKRSAGSDCSCSLLYMSLVPVIQPPIMKLLTTEEERKIKMEHQRPVSKAERICFPIVATIVVCGLLPATTPLVGMLMLGNLFRESGVVRQLQETASNALMYIVVILLGTSVGATTSAEAFLN